MIKAVIADDAPVLRQMLADLFEANGIQVVASAKNGSEAVDMVKEHKPDVLILDCEMPVMNGLDALKIIMRDNPLPVFMFSALTREGASTTIKAMGLGAIDFLAKPTADSGGLEAVSDELLQKIRTIVTRSRLGLFSKKFAGKDKVQDLPALPERRIRLIAMGSSTGGVQAAGEVIPRLPANLPPVVWVQHMPPNFTKSLAERLDGLSKVRVHEAVDGQILEYGHCYLAPGGFQMRLVKSGPSYKLRVGGTDKVSGHCPSCNVLFSSVSEYFAADSMGIILTGMGDDGTEGLVKMHAKGAYVIGQDEPSCVVYGMPRAAYLKGAVDVQLHIGRIADAVVRIASPEARQSA